jgi:hypothetical protein
MSIDAAIMEKIRANAERVVSIANMELGKNVGYDKAGVEWLDGFIQRQHEQGDQSIRNSLVQTLGAYLGECIVHSFGGKWAHVNGKVAISFNKDNAVFPFEKVQKHLYNGHKAGDSVLGFYTSVITLFREFV